MSQSAFQQQAPPAHQHQSGFAPSPAGGQAPQMMQQHQQQGMAPGASQPAMSHVSQPISASTQGNRSMVSESNNLHARSTDPTDLLVSRLHALKRFVKACMFYFQGMAEAELESAKRFSSLAASLPSPIKDDNVFMPLGEHGLQDLVRSIKSVTESNSNFFHESNRSTTDQILPELERLYNEIKFRISNSSGQLLESHKRLVDQRGKCQAEFARLAGAMATARATPGDLDTDPFLVNLDVRRQIHHRANEEHYFYKSAVNEQNSFLTFESQVIQRLKDLLKSQFNFIAKDLSMMRENALSVSRATDMLPNDMEWNNFCHRHEDQFVDPTAGPITAAEIPYPHRDDPSLSVVKEGYLELQAGSGPMKVWKNYYAVLTALGFLHLFPSGDLVHCRTPALSLYLPNCSLGALNLPELPHNAFTISAKDRNARDGIGRQYLFRTGGPDLSQEWWNALTTKVRVHLVASVITHPNATKAIMDMGEMNSALPSANNSGIGSSASQFGGQQQQQRMMEANRNGQALSESDFSSNASSASYRQGTDSRMRQNQDQQQYTQQQYNQQQYTQQQQQQPQVIRTVETVTTEVPVNSAAAGNTNAATTGSGYPEGTAGIDLAYQQQASDIANDISNREQSAPVGKKGKNKKR
ncbi:hypothetical protein IWQ60_000558 [Tieghemiomyces parasiticus]|uniref:PH domain-containing protein n=1 Tax=Tieghemiomyces parasiticus TaxID=78921 RepID=A0A9W8AIA2_9FUNG|nr:hypothetical protein IWQ60_000558 [Tieghemiomyces parasiticus]